MKILRTFLKYKYCNNCKKINILNDVIQENLRINQNINQVLEYNENITKINFQNSFPVIITVQLEFDYKGKITNINFYAYKYNISRHKFSKVQSLFTTLVYYNNLPRYIKIIDFRGIMCHGYGTMIMSEFLLFIKSIELNTIDRITGFLSVVDSDHWDMLYHFYGKFGFKITEDKHIILNLKADKK